MENGQNFWQRMCLEISMEQVKNIDKRLVGTEHHIRY